MWMCRPLAGRESAACGSWPREHLPPGHAGDYNQALMDLGARSVRRAPRPAWLCPLAELCQARLGVQEERPCWRKRAPVPHYMVTAAVIRRAKRAAHPPANGRLLGGLWEFPGGKVEPAKPCRTACGAK